MPMLEGEPALTLELLNQATQAWVKQEYHRTEHSEIGATPLARIWPAPTCAATVRHPRCSPTRSASRRHDASGAPTAP